MAAASPLDDVTTTEELGQLLSSNFLLAATTVSLTKDLRPIPPDEILPGKLYARPLYQCPLRGAYYLWHWGIGTEECQMVDFNSGRPEYKSLQQVTYEEFAAGKPVYALDESYYAIYPTKTWEEIKQILASLQDCQLDYNPLGNNCATFAFWVVLADHPYKGREDVPPRIGQFKGIIGTAGLLSRDDLVDAYIAKLSVGLQFLRLKKESE